LHLGGSSPKLNCQGTGGFLKLRGKTYGTESVMYFSHSVFLRALWCSLDDEEVNK